MKNKLITIFKIASLAFLALLWLIPIQNEYEIITTPELQSDFPLIKGIWAEITHRG